MNSKTTKFLDEMAGTFLERFKDVENFVQYNEKAWHEAESEGNYKKIGYLHVNNKAKCIIQLWYDKNSTKKRWWFGFCFSDLETFELFVKIANLKNIIEFSESGFNPNWVDNLVQEKWKDETEYYLGIYSSKNNEENAQTKIVNISNNLYNRAWTIQELEATVSKYIEMREKEENGEKFIKKSYYESLSNEFGRTTKSFEYRMQNISYVYALMGRKWITGLKPASHIGSKTVEEIENIINRIEGQISYPAAKFASAVNELKKNKNIPPPRGSKRPKKTTSESTQYNRDPAIVAWVLNNARGICESCSKPAPFTKEDGTFFLEVHHMKNLADKGSDTITNAIALCPNCHRMLHYGEDKARKIESLYSQMDRLVRE
ncbi:HNH endonuclease [Desulfosediminicola ganghwensis]|uniref:HNH endonuclease n=1 Tax=Desulfosediminicola ganghwensis TaxID=2569540 RepID=UPI001C3DCFD0|nr:HNH endonuclease signature motif containing protein [Desulfosediminicola ganghwensis]